MPISKGAGIFYRATLTAGGTLSGKILRGHRGGRNIGQALDHMFGKRGHMRFLFAFLAQQVLRRICALPAFWVGLLYDQSALDSAWDLVKDWSEHERQTLRELVPRSGLQTPFRTGTVLDIAREATKISRAGLKARNRRDSLYQDEALFLETVRKTVRDGRSPAQDLLRQYEEEWDGDIDRLFKAHAY